MSFWSVTGELLEGLAYTLTIFGVTLVFALVLGLVISFGTMTRFAPLRLACRGFVWVIRGTPLMLQIIFFAFGPGLWLGIPIRTTAAQLMMVCVAFIVNYACYFSEIFRGGIQSVPAGQAEAAQVLGMKKSEIFFKVTLLQVIKRTVPPLSNEIITLVKDTALASVVIGIDLFTVAKNISNVEATLWPIFYAGFFYLIFNGILTLLFGKIEKKLSYFKV
ncbi:MAG: amino acid ABC transporter permease [Clostridia bacterium]|nr:amino acid ABC transporter permease [Clostridia bacterium]MBO7293643.1 amino acid ABC transporter permease [Clostridia bacterium]